MFKLRLINKIEPFKLKCNFKFPDIVLAKFQIKEVEPKIEDEVITADHGYDALSEVKVKAVTSAIDSNIKSTNIKDGVNILGIVGSVQQLNGEAKEITPTKENQTIIPTAPKNALTSVKVKAIPDEYIVPTGKLTINENGNYDATTYTNVEVNVPTGESEYFTETIVKGTYESSGWLHTLKKIASSYSFTGDSASYMFSNYLFDELPEIDFSNVIDADYLFTKSTFKNLVIDYDFSNLTRARYMLNDCPNLESVVFNSPKNSKIVYFDAVFQNCKKLKNVDLSWIDTRNATYLSQMFYNCSLLENIDEMNADSCNYIANFCRNTPALKTFGGLKNLGKGYDKSSSANYWQYTCDITPGTNLTEQSLINFLTKLFDIATKGCNVQQIIIGPTNIAKLTSTEGQAALAQATSYGWTVS